MKKTSILLLISVFIFVGCNNDVLQTNVPPEEHHLLEAQIIDHIMDTEYTTEVISLIDHGVENAKGLMVLDGKIVISDSNQSKLLFFDDEMKLESEVKIPSGLGVSKMCANSQHIYVLDPSMGIIYVLDIKTLTEVKQISMPIVSASSIILDFGLLEDELYLSLCSPNRSNSGIIRINIHTGASESLDFTYKDNSGYFDVHDENLYFANILELTSKDGTSSLHVGKNILGKIVGNKLTDTVSLVEGSTSGDFIITDSEIIVYSVSWHSLDRYNRDGKYISTLSYIENESLDNVLVHLNHEYLLLVVGSNKLYKIHKEGIK